MPALDIPGLQSATGVFASELQFAPSLELFGVTDGKAVGTFVENALHEYFSARFEYRRGSAARGIDFPDQNVDLKVTSIRQPQSSCPYRSAEQKVYGLGYHLLVLIYRKVDDQSAQTATLQIGHALFIDAARTADYQTTRGLREIIVRDGNLDDIVAFLEDRRLPLDEVGRAQLGERIMSQPPAQGWLTISNALQWRLQYGRLIAAAADGGPPDGIRAL